MAAENPARVEDRRESPLFYALDRDGDGFVSREQISQGLTSIGFLRSDPRLTDVYSALDPLDDPPLDLATFARVIAPASILVERAIRGTLAIPDFGAFRTRIEQLYHVVRENRDGQQADYIPPLADVDPEQFAVAIVTVDGQQLAVGDANVDFSIQSTCKPFNYCFALEELGEEKVHEHIGREPSGHEFNAYLLQGDMRPHNPMINAGAIMCTSLIQRRRPLSERFAHIRSSWACLTGGESPRFNAHMATEEARTGDRNRALAYMMKNEASFPDRDNFDDEDLRQTLELYFKICSLELTAKEMAMAAATLANGGVNPMTHERVFDRQTVRSCVSLMYSCGMYDFSGEFAFSIGVPAKSGVGGAVLLVVPALFGVCIWSPRLDKIGNSVRGVEFGTRMLREYRLHTFDGLEQSSERIDPRMTRARWLASRTAEALWAASNGDIDELRRLAVEGFDLSRGDYDRRTALHLAAAEGHLNVVDFLLEQGVSPTLRDRWGGTPLDDAQVGDHDDVAERLLAVGATGGETNHAPSPSEAITEVSSGVRADPTDVVQLLWAASEGLVGGMVRLVANGVPIDCADYDGRTALHLAAADGRIEAARYLLAHGHPVQVRDRWGATPLDEARRESRTDVIALLEAHGFSHGMSRGV